MAGEGDYQPGTCQFKNTYRLSNKSQEELVSCCRWAGLQQNVLSWINACRLMSSVLKGFGKAHGQQHEAHLGLCGLVCACCLCWPEAQRRRHDPCVVGEA